MIIDPSRIAAGDHKQALEYILAVGNTAKHENEDVTLLEGYPEGLALHCATAKDAFPGKKYTLRHWKINPEEFTSAEDLQSICHDLMREFKTGDRPFVIALHTTNHANGERITHAHLMVAELDGMGKVLSNKNNAAREHKIARKWEKKLGHNILSSRYDAAIAENEPALADDLQPKNVVYKYTQGQFQKAQKLGVDLNEINKTIDAIRAGEHDIKDIENALSQFGVSLNQGNKNGVLVIEKDGTVLAPLHKAGAFHRDEMIPYFDSYINNHKDSDNENGFEQIEPDEFSRADNRADIEKGEHRGEHGEILQGKFEGDEAADRRHSPSSDGAGDDRRRDADGPADASDRSVDARSERAERSEQSIEENAVRAEQQTDGRTKQTNAKSRPIRVDSSFLHRLRLRVRDFAFVRKFNAAMSKNKSLISTLKSLVSNSKITPKSHPDDDLKLSKIKPMKRINIDASNRISEERLKQIKELAQRARNRSDIDPHMPIHKRIEFIIHEDKTKRENEEMHRMFDDVKSQESEVPKSSYDDDYQQPRFR